MLTKSLLIRLTLAAALAWSALVIGPTKGHAQSAVQVPLVCESQRFQPELCDTGEPVISADLTSKLSREPCDGRFATTPTGIAVVSGCRAAFDVRLNTTRGIFPLLCSSDNFQPRTCVAPQARAAGSRVRAAWVIERQSRSSCVAGQNFQIVGDSIQVSGGCRANFLYTVE